MANNPDETDVGFDSVISQMFKSRPQQMKAVMLVSPVCASKLQMPFDAVRLVLASFIPTTPYPVTYARDVFCDGKKDFDYHFKIFLIGDSGCGKTRFMMHFVGELFPTGHHMSIGIDFRLKHVGYRREPAACVETIKLQLWDLGPDKIQVHYKTRLYSQGNGIFACFDVSSRPSFENVKSWVDDIRKHGSKTCVMIVVGMKADDAKPREVPIAEAEALAHSFHVPYVECSSRDDYHVQDAVATMVHLIRKGPLPPPVAPKVVPLPVPPTKRCQLM